MILRISAKQIRYFATVVPHMLRKVLICKRISCTTLRFTVNASPGSGVIEVSLGNMTSALSPIRYEQWHQLS